MTTGRLHARTITAGQRSAGEQIELLSPTPGVFRSSVRPGDVIRHGAPIGLLEVLGQTIELLAPEVGGAVVAIRDPRLARAPVDHGGVLVTLDPRATTVLGETAALPTAAQVAGVVFRAPTSGRFYGRPAPDKPPFVNAGDELTTGTTVCLLEVMKTFHRVTYGGGGLPEQARVREILVVEGADVTAGDPLLALE
jgi:acetyl-CoA carboxylase biotin carboxyl carrier protein